MSLDNPNYNNTQDRILFDKLFYHNNNGIPLTPTQERFCKTMYHMEEYASGLDGDDYEIED